MNACLTDLLGGEQAQLSHSITQLSVARELKSGEKLFDQGAHGDSMYLVMHGRLVASLKNGNNPPKIVMEVGRHEVIGEIALFTDQMRTATVFASRDSLVLEISRDNFEQLSKASPEFALHISKRVIDRLSRSMM
ncbi:cyclic nucleotide-binding domain-containing protein, partial [Pseudomonadales bacterium]|nr:cyclic nucleotide-binding domain-containing protein [Pseudomonadales bacterium]